MQNLELLRQLAHRPAPYGTGGPHELWTDPHVQGQLLAAHLDPELDAASPPHTDIDRGAAFIVDHLGVDGDTRVLDLGCGPGLYAERLAAVAGHVHGIDLSATSIAEARRRAPSRNTTFTVGDYLTDDLPEHDLALLLMRDYTAMSPAARTGLLRRIRARLSPGGRLLLDVPTPVAFARVREGCTLTEQPDGGFWAAAGYVEVHQTFRYADALALDRYLVAEAARTRTVHVWTGHLDVEAARAELAAAGLTLHEVHGDITGAPYDPDGEVVALVAGPVQ